MTERRAAYLEGEPALDALKRRQGKRGHKFRAQVTVYRDVRYPSKLEAERARFNDLRVAAGELTGWRRGRPWPLVDVPHPQRPGKRLTITYRPDFECWTHPDESDLWCEETKGVLTDSARLKLILFRVVYPTVKLLLVRKGGQEEWV